MAAEDQQDPATIAELRRREVAILKGRLSRLEKEVRALKESNEFLVETLTNFSKEMELILSAFSAASGAFRVLEIIGRIGKPLLVIGSIVSGLYALWTKARPGG